MRLTRSVSYAVSVLLNVERGDGRSSMTAAQISKNCDFPPRFLYRILRRLVDSKLLSGVSGPGGGYRLARPAREITLLEIVMAVEGPQTASVLEPVCRTHQPAIDAVNQVCQESADHFSAKLESTTLAQLLKAKPAKKRTAKKPAKRARGKKKTAKRSART